jgi:hypothetical protein
MDMRQKFLKVYDLMASEDQSNRAAPALGCINSSFFGYWNYFHDWLSIQLATTTETRKGGKFACHLDTKKALTVFKKAPGIFPEAPVLIMF